MSGTTLSLDASQGGAVDRQEMLDCSSNPTRDAQELDTYGWKAGYKQIFGTSNTGQQGVFLAEVNVSLTDAQSKASQVPSQAIIDFQADVGKAAVCADGSSVTSSSVTPFTPSIPGASGAVLHASVDNSTEFYSTVIFFSHGPIVATAQVAAYDDQDLRSATEMLASRLQSQIQSVLGNETTSP